MSLTILFRLAPALAVAAGVAWSAARDRGHGPGAAVDQVLRATVVALVAARLGWLLLAGPRVWRSLTSTAFLVRAGVETMLGVLVAIAWLAWRSDAEERAWLVAAAPSAALAGVATWQGLCAVEGVCAGIPAGWGVQLSGFAGPVAPVGYIEAGVAALLAVVAFRYRSRPAVGLAAAAGYALARAGLGFLRAPLVTLPTRDQMLAVLVAVVLTALALRLRDTRRAPA